MEMWSFIATNNKSMNNVANKNVQPLITKKEVKMLFFSRNFKTILVAPAILTYCSKLDIIHSTLCHVN